MNTLSRKHRLLRQAAANKENQVTSNNNNNNYLPSDEGPDEFRVIKVVHSEAIGGPPAARHSNRHHSRARGRNESAGVQPKEKSAKSWDRRAQVTGSMGSSRLGSLGDSSGFLSEESHSSHCSPGASMHKRQNQVIDQLGRLMAGGGSPTESLAGSTLRRDSTLTRGHELGYSTLCRDEFSSFIATDEARHEPMSLESSSSLVEAGPTLVGVHQDDVDPRDEANLRPPSDPSSCLSSPASSTEGNDRLDGEASSTGYDCSSPYSSSSPQLSSGGHQRARITPTSEESATQSPDKEPDSWNGPSLELQLDLYLERMSKIKSHIASHCRAKQAVVVPRKKQEPKEMKVLQEIQMIELPMDEEPTDDDQSLARSGGRLLDMSSSVAGAGQAAEALAQTPRTEPAIDLGLIFADLKWEPLTVEPQISSGSSRRLETSLWDSWLSCGEPADKRLTGSVKGQLSEFLGHYTDFQHRLRRELAADWRQNWLFASKRPTDSVEPSSVSTKRAKRMDLDDDLLRYSTLLMANKTSVKVTIPEAEKDTEQMEHFQAIYSAAYADECQDLTSHLQIGADYFIVDLPEAKDSGRKGGKSLSVSYGSHWADTFLGSQFKFAAHGYRFRMNHVAGAPMSDARAKRLDRLRTKILTKLRDLIQLRQQASIPAQDPIDRVKFVIGVASAELTSQLPVIQFCAKVTGALPISVSWFRLREREDGEPYEELISSLELPAQGDYQFGKLRRDLRVLDSGTTSGPGVDWPLGLRATHELEYRNEWGSWFRFRRRQGELMFEVRHAHAEHDFGQRFLCRAQNYCSQADCHFTLTKRPTVEPPRPLVRARESAKVAGEKRHALLRTWSQRTLHKPAVSERPAESPEAPIEPIVGQRSLGRRPPSPDGSKLGPDFPYHPHNLLKRLEENKLAGKGATLRRLATGGEGDSTPGVIARELDQRQTLQFEELTEIEHQAPKETFGATKRQEPPIDNLTSTPRARVSAPSKRPEEPRVAPAPRQRANQIAGQSATLSPPSSERPTMQCDAPTPEAKPTKPMASVRSLISRFNLS